MDQNTVVDIRPKTQSFLYRRQPYTVTFDPRTKKWIWDVTFVSTTPLHGDGATITAAEKAAKRMIDKMIDGD